jgi:hypothetical protein
MYNTRGMSQARGVAHVCSTGSSGSSASLRGE